MRDGEKTKSFSTEKVLSVISVFSKHPFELKYRNKTLPFLPPDKLYISPTLFRSMECVPGCGWCCNGPGKRAFSLDYYPTNIEEFKKSYPHLVESLTPIPLFINGKEKVVYSDSQRDHKNPFCKHLSQPERRCGIHQANPFSCRFEILKGDRKRNIGYLMKKKFSRGWMKRGGVCASCIIRQFNVFEFKKDIQTLKEFNDISNYFEIKTWLPEILNILENVNVLDLPKDKIFVGVNNG